MNRALTKMTHHRTAPMGFTSNFEAVMQIIRFGPALWTPSELMVLLFHAERSTLYGRQSDQHSQGQAVGGVYSRKKGRWVRGPVGVSLATWKRANTTLSESGFIKCRRRCYSTGGNAATEFEIDWLAVKTSIETVASSPAPEAFEDPNLSLDFNDENSQANAAHYTPVEEEEYPQYPQDIHRGLAHSEPRSAQPEPMSAHDEPRDRLTMSHTVSEVNSSNSFSEDSLVSESPSAAVEISQAIKESLGNQLPPTDPLPGKFVALADQLHVSHQSVCRWIHDKCAQKRRDGYTIENAGALYKFAQNDLIPWIKTNRRLVELDLKQQERSRAVVAALKPQAKPASPAGAMQPDPEFAASLLARVAHKHWKHC